MDIILDGSVSKSVVNNEAHLKLHSNGGRTFLVPVPYYVKAGDVLTVTLNDPVSVNLSVDVLTTTAYTDQSTPLIQGTNIIECLYDGEVYLYNNLAEGETTTVILTGGREMPIFTLGVNDDSEFQGMLESESPNIHLIGNKTILTGPKHKFINYNVNNPSELLTDWDERVVYVGEKHYGFDYNLGNRHHPMTNKIHFLDVGDAGPGAMYTTAYHFGTGTSSTFIHVIATTDLVGEKGWGCWHEYGHSLQPTPFGLPGMGEVTENITANYIRTDLGFGSRIADSWDSTLTPYINSDDLTKNYFTTDQLDLFGKLGLWWQLHLTFGVRFYKKLLLEFRNDYYDDSTLYQLTSDERVQALIVKSSKVSGYNLIPFYNKWGVYPTEDTQNQISSLGLGSIDNIWENTDQTQPHTHYDFGNDINVAYNGTSILVEYDYYRTQPEDTLFQLFLNGEYQASYKNGVAYYGHSKLDPDNGAISFTKSQTCAPGDILTAEFTDASGEKFIHSITI